MLLCKTNVTIHRYRARMQYPLTAPAREVAYTAAANLKRLAVASARLLCVAGMIAATCAQLCFSSAPTDLRKLLARRTALLLDILGVHVEIEGLRRAPHAPALIVSNHISWLDALAIQQHFACNFVVKSEVFHWPIVGWLCRAANGISIERGSAFGLVPTLSEVNAALEAQTSVGVFPEGTTSCGDAVMPFSNGIFQAAIASEALVQPIFIAYRNSDRSQSYAFIGDDHFLGSLWRICLTARTVLSIRCLPALAPSGTRRQLCTAAHTLIAAA